MFVVNGVLGVEVGTQRLWERAKELGVARLVYVNMLDRERADFFRVLDALKAAFGAHVVATEIPIGQKIRLTMEAGAASSSSISSSSLTNVMDAPAISRLVQYSPT